MLSRQPPSQYHNHPPNNSTPPQARKHVQTPKSPVPTFTHRVPAPGPPGPRGQEQVPRSIHSLTTGRTSHRLPVRATKVGDQWGPVMHVWCVSGLLWRARERVWSQEIRLWFQELESRPSVCRNELLFPALSSAASE